MMKRIWRIVTAMTLVIACAGCSVGSGKNQGKPADPANATEIPDYTDSTARMNMYAYVGPTPGNYTTAAGQQVYGGDNRSVESYQEYKDCGFDTLMLLGNDAYKGEDFASSNLKRNLDMAQEVGLKVIVFDTRMHDLSATEDGLIGEGKEFASLEELTQKVAEYMSPYMDHPAFYGISLVDEPTHSQFQALGETTKAIKAVKKEIFVHTVLLPYLDGVSLEAYTEATIGDVNIDSYKTYVNDYLDASGADYFGYDNYPFLVNGLLGTYYRNMQVAVTEAAAKNADVVLSVQSCEMLGRTRMPEENDFRFQANSALAFGVKNLLYYTYWMFPNRTVENYVSAIMDDDGTRIAYDTVQKVNADIQKMAKVLLHFDYEKAAFTYDKENAISAPAYFSGLKNSELDGAAILAVSAPTMVSQMKDSEKNLTGYMVMNSSDPSENMEDTVRIRFEEYDYATIYVKGEAETVGLTDNVLEMTLECGDAAFVIPHK